MPVLADNAVTLTAIGAITLLSLSISFTLATARRSQSEIKALRHDNAICTWRQTVLIETMHTAQMPVPSWIWGTPPDGVQDMTPEELRGLAQRMIDPYGGHLDEQTD